MKWSLVREWGNNQARAADASPTPDLCHPTRAVQADDGSYLISEEQGIEKLVPFRFECRTLRLDADQNILFDSITLGIDDGFGCLMEGGDTAILRRTKWELLIVSSRGVMVDQLRLECFSKRIPRYVSWTYRGTFLVVFYNRSFEVDIVEVDRQGRLLWFLPAPAHSIGIPATVELLPTGTLLIADSFRHVVIEVDRDGRLIWQHGVAASPSDRDLHLSSPSSARSASGGSRLIADTRNHRILSLTPDGARQILDLNGQDLCDPTYADELSNGNYLICDTGNSRVIELDKRGQIVWQYGRQVASRRRWSYPRSIDIIDSQTFLVADTGANRVMRIRQGDIEPCMIDREKPLFWPRCARQLADGGLLIADSRNRRIVEVSADGFERRQISALNGLGPPELEDPHDVQRLPNDHLLITDSSHNVILEVDWSGRVHRAIGVDGAVKLKDPHSAQSLVDGTILVADTGNHRMLFVSPQGDCLRAMHSIESDSCCFKLHHPRYGEVSRDGILVVSDTGNNRVLGATTAGRFLWEFSLVPTPGLERLNQPRWATLINPDELLVCDHFHHRVLHVKRDRATQAI